MRLFFKPIWRIPNPNPCCHQNSKGIKKRSRNIDNIHKDGVELSTTYTKTGRAIDNIHKNGSSYRQHTQKRSRAIDNIIKNSVELSTTC